MNTTKIYSAGCMNMTMIRSFSNIRCHRFERNFKSFVFAFLFFFFFFFFHNGETCCDFLFAFLDIKPFAKREEIISFRVDLCHHGEENSFDKLTLLDICSHSPEYMICVSKQLFSRFY